MKAFGGVVLAVAMFGAAPAAAQTQLPATGPVEHRAAATTFPERLGDYRRVSAVAFDPAGTDISAAYRLEGGDGAFLLTVYIYPAALHRVQPAGDAEACRSHFEATAGAVTRANQTARRRSQSVPLVVPAVPRDLSHRAVFDLERHASTPGPFVSELDVYCFVGGAWIVKYRTTSSPELDPAAAVATFVRSGPWPGRAVGGTVAQIGGGPTVAR